MAMMSQRRSEDGRLFVESLREVPLLANHDAYAAFWETHTPSEAYRRKHQETSVDAPAPDIRRAQAGANRAV
jgi:hypothetical protein